MRVLVTGAFGHIGTYTVRELLAQGHAVGALDLPTPANRRKAAAFGAEREVIWGDLRNTVDVARAVAGWEAVVHLAFVLPPDSERNPERAGAVNVGGSRQLIATMEAQPSPPRLIFGSSFSVHGDTLHDDALLTPHSPLRPINHYNEHKVAVEEMVRNSGLVWCILRFGTALATDLDRGFDPVIFDLPPAAKQEFVHPADVALAIANCLGSTEAWGKTWMIGGGKDCQVHYGEMINRMLEAAGIGSLPAGAFSSTARQGGGWMDTAESQRVLRYQRHSFGDFLAEFAAGAGWRRPLFRVLSPLIRWYIVRQSPYR
jgi:nucleoside-diphosphate-sugar epimerase